MTVNAVMLIVMGAMYAGGVYLLLERTLTRVLLGLMLITNATNLLIITMAGAPGRPPIVVPGTDPSVYSDPLPQALTLTAIVISFATTAFVLGVIYRSWKLGRRDEVQVDTEDVKVAEQPSFDAEDDAVLQEEPSEFIEEDEDPNAHYEHTSALNPSTGTLGMRHQPDGTVSVATEDEGDRPVGSVGDDDHGADEDERPGRPGSRPRTSGVPDSGDGGAARRTRRQRGDRP